jgi:hypothetical protein
MRGSWYKLCLIGIVSIEFLIDVRPFNITRISLDELMLYLVESLFAFPLGFFPIWIDVSSFHFDCLFEYAVEVELIRQFYVEVDPPLTVPFVDVPEAIRPHLIIVFSVSFVVGVDHLTQLPIREHAVHPLHLLRT